MTETEIAARLTEGLYAAADELLFTATTPWELDAAMADFGFASGLCADQDVLGLETVLELCTDAGRTATPALRRMVADGRLGRSVGAGWYRYPGGGGLVVDPLVEDLLREEAWFARVTRCEMSDKALIIRLMAGLSQAAVSLLCRGIETSRIDHVSLRDLGFPAATGGLLSHLRTSGPEIFQQAPNCLSSDEIQMLLAQP